MPELEFPGRAPAKIPADVDQADRVLFNLTARQAGILTATAVALYGLSRMSSAVVPPLVFLPIAALILALMTFAVTVRRDGLTLDRLSLAVFRHARAPHRQVLAPEGVGQVPAFLADAMTSDGPLPAPFDSPIRQVTDDGIMDLGSDGATVLAQCSTVNFALRTQAEQDVLIAGFARWLNALTGPVQIACSSQQIQLGERVAQLRDVAPGLHHPALEDAAREHANFLEVLAARGSLLDRSIFLAVHEDGPESGPRLARRADEAAVQLAACEIHVRTLTATHATSALIHALNPALPITDEGA